MCCEENKDKLVSLLWLVKRWQTVFYPGFVKLKMIPHLLLSLCNFMITYVAWLASFIHLKSTEATIAELADSAVGHAAEHSLLEHFVVSFLNFEGHTSFSVNPLHMGTQFELWIQILKSNWKNLTMNRVKMGLIGWKSENMHLFSFYPVPTQNSASYCVCGTLVRKCVLWRGFDKRKIRNLSWVIGDKKKSVFLLFPSMVLESVDLWIRLCIDNAKALLIYAHCVYFYYQL